MILSGMAPLSVRSELACLASFFGFLQDMGYIQGNPAGRLPLPKTEKVVLSGREAVDRESRKTGGKAIHVGKRIVIDRLLLDIGLGSIYKGLHRRSSLLTQPGPVVAVPAPDWEEGR